MTTERWPVPHGTGGGVRHTVAADRTVLAVVHGVAAGRRLCDAITAVETLPGVQVVFTSPPVPGNGVNEFLTRTGALTTPWNQALQDRFDLTISTSATGVDQLDGPVLLLPSLSEQGRIVDHHGRDAITAVRRVLNRPIGARRAPLVIGVPRQTDLHLLSRLFPEVGRHAQIAGDPSFDRLLRIADRRTALRAQLGMAADDRVGLMLSSRGSSSLLGREPGTLQAISRAGRHQGDRLYCSLHPDVWIGHGVRQVRAWTAGAVREGLVLIPPHADWRPVLAASDYVIGDHGIVTSYAAALGKPVRFAHAPKDTAQSDLLIPTLLPSHHPSRVPAASRSLDRITSAPLRSSALLRGLAMRLLGAPM